MISSSYGEFNIKPRLRKFSDCIGISDYEIQERISNILLIDNYQLLIDNIDILRKIISFNKVNKFNSTDFNALKCVEDNLSDYKNVTLSLIDDFQNKDRSYIDSRMFEKSILEIPFIYLLWNVTFDNNQNISAFYNKNFNMMPENTNGFESISKNELLKIKEIIEKLSDKFKNYDSIEKIILISDYLQDKVQFVQANNVSEGVEGLYLTDSKGINVTRKMVGSPINVLFNNYGVCNGIAHATSLLLNNPIMNVNARSVNGSGHTWNIVEIDGKHYYVDNTWNITRNKDRYPSSLKARTFSSEYLLFGTDTADRIGNHILGVSSPDIEKKDLDRSIVKVKEKKLERVAKFNNYNKPVFNSILKK